ncbi:MAG TPA: hypothetical protein EYG26_09560 [Planctomycetes bacterium]|nr:hypothetical protein [Planctomycetota bacterium]
MATALSAETMGKLGVGRGCLGAACRGATGFCAESCLSLDLAWETEGLTGTLVGPDGSSSGDPPSVGPLAGALFPPNEAWTWLGFRWGT